MVESLCVHYVGIELALFWMSHKYMHIAMSRIGLGEVIAKTQVVPPSSPSPKVWGYNLTSNTVSLPPDPETLTWFEGEDLSIIGMEYSSFVRRASAKAARKTVWSTAGYTCRALSSCKHTDRIKHRTVYKVEEI